MLILDPFLSSTSNSSPFPQSKHSYPSIPFHPRNQIHSSTSFLSTTNSFYLKIKVQRNTTDKTEALFFLVQLQGDDKQHKEIKACTYRSQFFHQILKTLPDLSTRSEPARSTKISLPFRTSGGFDDFAV